MIHNTKIAIYGKGGIGKSTVSANLSAALSNYGKKVLQIGCDPKHDSTRMLLGGASVPTVLDYLREVPAESRKLEDILHHGYRGTRCVEAGGPQPGVGCAGRGILSTFETLDELGIRDIEIDITIYDVLGDVVCGGFAVPLRKEYANIVLIVTSGEYMSLYAANNILRGVASYDNASTRVGGIVFNGRGLVDEERMVRTFADAVGLPILTSIPRSEVFSLAEAKGCTVVEAYPGSKEAALFKELAGKVEAMASGVRKLHQARPMDDEAMERVLLGRHRQAVTAPNFASSPSAPLPYIAGSGRIEKPRRNIDTSKIVHGCAFAGAAVTVAQFRNAVTVVHGPLSCANLASYYVSGYGTNDLTNRFQQGRPLHRIVSTAMDGRSMVFGGISELEEVTRGALRQGYDVAFIITTCPSGLMGEDVEATALRIERSMPGKRVVVVPADGNIYGNYSKGIILALSSAASLIDPAVAKEPGTVNIVGEKGTAINRDHNFSIIKDILSKFSLRVNCRYLSGASLQEVSNFQKGEVSLLANYDPAAKKVMDLLSSRTGAEQFPLPFPRGFEETSAWLVALGERFGKEREAASLISSYREEYERAIDALSPGLKGKKILIASSDIKVGWIADLAGDLGMDVLKIGIASSEKDILSGSAIAPKCRCHLGYTEAELEEDIKALRPDLLITQPLFGLEGLGVRHTLIPYSPSVGISSGIEMARRWSMLMRVPAVEGWRQNRTVTI